MQVICNKCGAPLVIKEERIEWDGETRIEIKKCSVDKDTLKREIEDELRREIESGLRMDIEDDIRDELTDSIRDELEDELKDEKRDISQSIAKFHDWIMMKYLVTDLSTYIEFKEKLYELDLL